MNFIDPHIYILHTLLVYVCKLQQVSQQAEGHGFNVSQQAEGHGFNEVERLQAELCSLHEQHAVIENMQRAEAEEVARLQRVVADLEGQLEEKNSRPEQLRDIQDDEARLAEREVTLRKKEEELEEREQRLHEAQCATDRQARQLAEREDALAKNEAAQNAEQGTGHEESVHRHDDREASLAAREAVITQREEELCQKLTNLDEREQAMVQRLESEETRLAAREKAALRREEDLDQREAAVDLRQQQIEQGCAERSRGLDEREAAIAERERRALAQVHARNVTDSRSEAGAMAENGQTNEQDTLIGNGDEGVRAGLGSQPNSEHTAQQGRDLHKEFDELKQQVLLLQAQGQLPPMTAAEKVTPAAVHVQTNSTPTNSPSRLPLSSRSAAANHQSNSGVSSAASVRQRTSHLADQRATRSSKGIPPPVAKSSVASPSRREGPKKETRGNIKEARPKSSHAVNPVAKSKIKLGDCVQVRRQHTEQLDEGVVRYVGFLRHKEAGAVFVGVEFYEEGKCVNTSTITTSTLNAEKNLLIAYPGVLSVIFSWPRPNCIDVSALCMPSAFGMFLVTI